MSGSRQVSIADTEEIRDARYVTAIHNIVTLVFKPGLTHRLTLLLCLLLLSSCQFLSAPFPDVDKAKLRMTLQRTGCYGTCPDYKVTIEGNGRVVFETRPLLDPTDVANVHRAFSNESGIRVSGTFETTITPEAVAELLEKFKEARFFSLQDEYRSDVTDNPTYIVSIDTGHRQKSVVDYVGKRAGMPKSVTALQDAIDAAAQTDRWIKGTSDVIPLLIAKRVNFFGPLGLELVDAAAERNDLQALQRLKALGAPLLLTKGPNPLRTAIRSKHKDAMEWLIANGAIKEASQWAQALQQAVDTDNHGAFQTLYASPRSRSINAAFATKLLTSAAANADPAIAEEMLRRGANPNGDDASPFAVEPPLFQAAGSYSFNGVGHSAPDRRKVVRILLAAGAKADHCKRGYCDSVLWGVDDPEVARLLLDAGADPNFKDSDGEHVLFNISEEDVALLLIARGASLRAVRPADGKTLRAWSEYQKWPRVLKILDRAGR